MDKENIPQTNMQKIFTKFFSQSKQNALFYSCKIMKSSCLESTYVRGDRLQQTPNKCFDPVNSVIDRQRTGKMTVTSE